MGQFQGFVGTIGKEILFSAVNAENTGFQHQAVAAITVESLLSEASTEGSRIER